MVPLPESGPVRATERYPDDSQLDRTMAVVGGTGPQGRGLAYRFALATRGSSMRVARER